MGLLARGNATAPPPAIDWPDLERRIVAGLDVAAEYAALGVEFTKAAARADGVRECRAFGREDAEPSAMVNVRTGVYHDSGGAGDTMGLLNFALRHGGGRWGRWAEVVRHYAAKAGVEFAALPSAGRGRVLEVVYRYRDPAGALAFGVHRLRLPNGDKAFRQYPWAGDGWHKAEGCMAGVPLYPYRLPELLAAPPDEPAWVVEGEKDADRAATLGLVATCNPMGAGKWRDEFSAYLRGRECFVLPDNDPAGRSHAAKVAASLAGAGASVKVVELPGTGYHGDLSDWLDAGGTLEELGRLAHAAPAWSGGGPGGAEDDDRDATVADLRTLAAVESWLWPLWIPGAAPTLLAAEPGVGKTRFCFDLCRRIFRGLPWPDGTPMAPATAGGRSLWVVADNQWQEMVDIAAAFGIPDEFVAINAPASDPYSGTSLEAAEELADFEARIRRVRPAIVIIDTITNTGDFKAQDASDAKRQYKPLQEIATRCGVPVVCVTHLNAGGKVLGRRAAEKVRSVIQMECPDPDGQPTRRKLWVSKSKALRPAALGVSMGEPGNEYDGEPPAAPEPARHGGATTGPPPVKTTQCMEWLAAHLARAGRARVSATRTAAEEAGYSADTLYKAKDRLGILETVDHGGKKWWEAPAAAAVNGANGHGHDPPF